MKLSNLFWKAIAWLVSRPWIATALIRFSQLRPFSEIRNQAGVLYMSRWWVFNPYPTSSQNRRRWNLPISIRVHHIVRPGDDRAMHDHPWNARTIILRGSYTEKRPSDLSKTQLSAETQDLINRCSAQGHYELAEYFTRRPGDTATLRVGEYHTITDVSEGGVYTLFISGKWRADWGFLVNGVKVWWRTYLYGTPFNEKDKSHSVTEGPTADNASGTPCIISDPIDLKLLQQKADLVLSMQQEADLAEWEHQMATVDPEAPTNAYAEMAEQLSGVEYKRFDFEGRPVFKGAKSFIEGGYTGGGFPGLAPGEVPAILTNERVFRQEDFDRLNIGYTTPGNVTVNMTIDPADLDRPSKTIQALIDAGKRHRGEL